MKSVQFCLILASFLVLQFVFVNGSSADPEDFKKMTAAVRKKCLAETKTTLQTVEDTEYGNFPEDDRLKCYFRCAFEKFGIMDKNGKIKYNLLKKVIPEAYREIGNDMVDSCSDVTADNKCEKVFLFMKCMYYVNPMAFIAP